MEGVTNGEIGVEVILFSWDDLYDEYYDRIVELLFIKMIAIASFPISGVLIAPDVQAFEQVNRS